MAFSSLDCGVAMGVLVSRAFDAELRFLFAARVHAIKMYRADMSDKARKRQSPQVWCLSSKGVAVWSRRLPVVLTRQWR